MRLVMQVYERQCRTAANAGECVLQNMASLSISRVLEDLQDGSSSSHSRDGGRSTSSGSGGSDAFAELAQGSNHPGSGVAAAADSAAAAATGAAAAGTASPLAASPSAGAAAASAGAGADGNTASCAQPDLAAASMTCQEDGANENYGAAQIALIDCKLQRYMRLRNIQACAGNFLILSHMDKLQLAELFIGALTQPVKLDMLSSCNIQMYCPLSYCVIMAGC
jgi:hypothetical protein